MFRFKQFEIAHTKSAFKVGTDAVLLGAWTSIPVDCKKILDIGSGCGVISLMLAQRSEASITGVDIDSASVEEATENADRSQWKNRLHFVHTSVQDFCTSEQRKQFDLIVSNPPFFSNSLKSPVPLRNLSRHTDALSFEDLVLSVDYCLSDDGSFAIILPVSASEIMQNLCRDQQLFCIHRLSIRPLLSKPVHRTLMLFSRKEHPSKEETLVLRETPSVRTDAYRTLTKEFYQWA
jgi:tRNA1Val (adenine37-N6)-methyltransferase